MYERSWHSEIPTKSKVVLTKGGSLATFLQSSASINQSMSLSFERCSERPSSSLHMESSLIVKAFNAKLQDTLSPKQDLFPGWRAHNSVNLVATIRL
jgi:hypothetical protein